MSRGIMRGPGVILLLLPLLLPPIAAGSATLTVDDDGADCPGAPYTTIGAAVAAAASGDAIEICDGTYVEQVVIDRSLTLRPAAGQSAVVVKAPAAMGGSKAIVLVTGAGVSAVIEGLTISGPGSGGCDSIRWGVQIEGAASAAIRGNTIRDIRDTPFSGCQNGIAVLVGRQSAGQTGTATIQDNDLLGYQKGGIVVDNSGSSATIEGNTLSGAGPTPVIAQNGIQVSRGASAAVRGNTIAGHFYTGCSNQDAAQTGCTPWVSAALLLYDVQASAVEHSNNMFRRNQFNLVLITEQSLAPGP